jgi:type II secretory ATPase GspE/PulE/Tfp pilus assembly ATPase PilB-like protein
MAKKDDDRPLHEQLPPVNFTAMGADDKQKDQGNLLAAKQIEAFPVAGGLIAHALTKRGERIMLDFTQSGVAVKYEVDGVWMSVDPRDRQSSDAMLTVLKKIGNLDPQERRARQNGKFGAEFHGAKYICDFTSQGVKTGERVLIKLDPKKAKFETIEELGMRPKMREQFKSLIDANQGFVIISTPPSNGLTALWHIGLNTADRFVRDFISLEDRDHPEQENINVGPVFYDAKDGQTPADLLPKLLLKQPDVFVVPELVNGDVVKILCEQVNKHQKMVVTRISAKEAAEAILRVLMLKGPVDEFTAAVSMALNGRLVRKLCDSCKQPFQPSPQMLQKLGIPAGRVQHLYREFQPPPPEQRVDAKGRPIEIEICKDCAGVGYLGRTSIFEMMVVTDEIRGALKKQANLDTVRKVARAGDHRTLQDEGILLVAQGVTSLNELQRVLKQ